MVVCQLIFLRPVTPCPQPRADPVALLNRFPYCVLYAVEDAGIFILAVMHLRGTPTIGKIGDKDGMTTKEDGK